MKRVLALVGRVVRKEEGQDLLEYGLLAVLIVITAVTSVTSLGNVLNTVLWESIAQNF